MELMFSVMQRKGIPEQRWKYWADPDWRTDRSIKDSPKGVFEKNGNSVKSTYEHPHFILYLRYFLFGAYLPSTVIEKFEREVDDLEPITSGDTVPLGEVARKLTLHHRLNKHGAALEFYKLCLDLELDRHLAISVRNSVMKIRSQVDSIW